MEHYLEHYMEGVEEYMKLRRVSDEDYKSETIKVHLSKREKDRLEVYASRLGMNISQYIRTKCIYEPYEKLESEWSYGRDRIY